MITHYRIIIKGGYGLFNFGDDALMVAVYSLVRKVFAANEIAFLCRDTPYIKKLIPEAQVIPLKSLDHNAHTDILLYGGGTQFYSFPLSRIKTQKVPGIQNILPYIFRPAEFFSKAMKRIHKKKDVTTKDIVTHNRSAALGIGLGPFVSHSIEEKRTRELLGKMEFIVVRDPISVKACRSWGIHNCLQGTDLCYLPNLWDTDRSDMKHRQTSPLFEKIGVIPRNWKHNLEGRAYFRKIFDLIDELRSKDKKITFILFNKKFDVEWSDILDEHKEEVIAWDPDSNSLDEFLEILSGFDAFITARYHGAVFASLLRKPSLCIGIEPKLEIIADQLKNLSAVWRFPYDIEEGLEQIQYLETNTKFFDKVIDKETQKAVDMAQKCINYLKSD